MRERGNARVGKPERSRGKRARVQGAGMKPEKYHETHLRDLARRVNGVVRDSDWHFECALFLCDLGKLPALAPPLSRRA